MKIYIKRFLNDEWVDITDKCDLPIVIEDNGDGTYDSTKITFDVMEYFGDFNYNEPVPPKSIVKIFDDIDEYYFLVNNSDCVRKRFSNEYSDELWEHTIDLIEYTMKLEDKIMPNYTITQPKTEYYDVYSRYGSKQITLNARFQHDGNKYNLPAGTITNSQFINNDGDIITIGYASNKHYIEIKDIKDISYNISLDLKYTKAGRTKTSNYLLNGSIFVGNSLEDYNIGASQTKLKITLKYYNASGSVIFMKDYNEISYFSGSYVEMESNSLKIIGLPTVETSTIQIPVNQYDAHRVVVEIDLDNLRTEKLYALPYSGYNTVPITTQIPNFANNEYNKAHYQTMGINVQSGQLKTAVSEKKQTMIEFLDKVLFDYNLNRRNKFTYSDNVRTKMDFIAKESEWSGYTFKEILTRAFQYVGGIPYLNIDNTIDIIIPQNVARDLEVYATRGLAKERKGLDFFDKSVSVSKNLMTDKDFTTETSLIGSTNVEFTQLRDDDNNMGFLTSQDIYFVSNAVLYAPNISFTLNGNVINTNMGKAYYWDITSRLLEEDIYNALPDVRFDTLRNFSTQTPSMRATGELSKGNTISYKSGANTIRNVYHQAPSIPSYNLATFIVNTNPAEYAIIEMLICLAYETLSIPAYQIPDIAPNIDFVETFGFELTIKYCPIFKELTTKYMSNLDDRKGLNWEKSFSLSDRVVSFDDNVKVLKEEMEKKGNEIVNISETYKTFSESIKVGGILPNGYYVSKKTLVIDNEITDVDYELSLKNLITNDDIGLSVEYDRFSVPYEHVQREMIIEEQWKFSNEDDATLKFLPHISMEYLFESIFKSGDINKQLYARFNMLYKDSSQKDILMRISKFESNGNLVLSGKFIDNYSAGNQRFAGDIANTYYSQPFKYCDYNGNVQRIRLREIGYSTLNSTNEKYNRLSIRNGFTYNPYPMERFPECDFTTSGIDYSAYMSNNFLENYIDLAHLKDAREGLALNMIFYKGYTSNDFKMVDFKPINKLAKINLPSDFEITDDLTFDDIQPYITNIDNVANTLTIYRTSNNSQMIFDITTSFTSGQIALLNVVDNSYTLCGVNKKPNYTGGVVRFYCYNNLYGQDS